MKTLYLLIAQLGLRVTYRVHIEHFSDSDENFKLRLTKLLTYRHWVNGARGYDDGKNGFWHPKTSSARDLTPPQDLQRPGRPHIPNQVVRYRGIEKI
ncbi:hypothetical protein CHS0354_025907 [Potamilus streckersoni]|uniref:Uncharacterized protein n=1 Tax=Potamilus streckersoni TaxID=2493646 RepID=A0AAE0T4F8_9BIVA|nr:hypothetical protein CHS0354_025907 [Potamilus streckersoni]